MNKRFLERVNEKLGKAAIIAVLAMSFANVTSAQDRMRIAVMDFNPGVGVDEAMVSGLSDMLINSLFETRRFTIVERTQLDAVIAEQSFQRSNLSAAQIAQIGRILGVKSVLVGTVNFIATNRTTEQVLTGMISGEFNLDVRIVDVESAEIVSTAGVTKTPSNTYRDLMPALAGDLTEKLFASDGGEVVKLFGYLFVFPEDLGNMNINEAKRILENVNAANLHGHNDWRLPELDELKLIYQNRAKIESLSREKYLSSGFITKQGYNINTRQSYTYVVTVGVDFNNGSEIEIVSNVGSIRLVRTDKK